MNNTPVYNLGRFFYIVAEMEKAKIHMKLVLTVNLKTCPAF